MYLKALKLHGFKSFADPSTLRFEPGVTAIVGPNGCGKSNIADSIRWVLGEQSAKALRGGKMQDVIFEGADTRKPAQMCEVSLLLTECEKQLGSEFHEIEITRRVHRDGQSEYFFNGQACRLKDIQKLFMDTGIGRTSYSIMAQGQIDQILSSKPEERRAVFEEAAGITKYKAQRREALQKLALTDQNLARVADVIGEVSRQIGSLRRQAAKAMRYKRLNHRLRHLALGWSGYHHAQLTATLGELEAKVATLRADADARRSNFENQQSSLDEKKAHRSRLNQRVQDAQQAVFDVRSQKEAAENAGNLAHIRRAGLEDRLASSRANLGELEMQLREVTAQVDTGAQDKQLQLELLGGSDAVFQQRNRELAIVEGELTKLEQELNQSKFQLLQLESTVARLRTDCSSYEVDQKTSAHRHESLAQELEGLRQQLSAAEQLSAETDARAEAALAEKSRANNEVIVAQQTITDLTKEFREGQRKLSEIDRALAQRTARLRLLQQLQEKWEGFGEGAKAVLQGRLDAALAGTPVAPITQGLAVKPEFGKAVEAILGAAAEAISVSDLDTARRILAQLENEQIGSAVLRVGDLGGHGMAPAELPAGLVPAGQALADPTLPHPAMGVLSECYIADDLNAFLEFWKANPAFPFLAVVTRRGDLVDRRGLIYGGFHSSKRSANSILQREIDLRETAKALADEQKQHDDQKLVIDALSARLNEAEQAVEQRRADVLAATQTLASVQSEQRNAQKNVEDAGNRLRRMENEIVGAEQARNEAQARWQKAQTGLNEADATATAQREKIHALEIRLNEIRTDRDVKRDTLGQARLELAERRQKVEVLDRGLGEMERRRQQLSELLVQRQHEIETWTEQITGLEQETEGQRSRAAQLAETLVVSQEQVEKIRAELVEVEREINGLESAQVAVRDEADAAHDVLSTHEVKLAENRQRAQFIAEEVTREFQLDIATIDWKQQIWRSEDEPEGMKPLDLDEDDDDAEPAAKQPEPVESKPEATPDAVAADAANGETVTQAAAPAKRRKKKKEARGEPTEADLAALEQTDWATVKGEIDALRQRLNSMGAVNLVAIEEYAELKQRHDFLQNQVNDLTTAKAELVKAIDEINQSSQKQFELTFEQIRKNFEYTFNTLFGGGVARLELIQTEDILESGIEIVAQPPGTKLKSITLLSGGQKTLTAVALLFALYMVKPSPFCLLDELDAPLDESNIGRFTDLLKKFVNESQFIIITHNKRTVSAAKAIYGVTMEERGVSKTVSMKFNAEHGEAEAQPVNIAESVRGAKLPKAMTNTTIAAPAKPSEPLVTITEPAAPAPAEAAVSAPDAASSAPAE
ncbi:chromosome segregation protein SMC [Opitutus sp. ER46]|uniref:chromosome segregation protein SMC n=1 Tax=Opitutus sp. ER46 TaxID=2161864 RepID=UPI000D31972C|nr:chromosome segregation protein SMC [Opitutus sp. ER46]PTX91229.1 chromosome segregation protein SMC [Opitutus sp. ER46]